MKKIMGLLVVVFSFMTLIQLGKSPSSSVNYSVKVMPYKKPNIESHPTVARIQVTPIDNQALVVTKLNDLANLHQIRISITPDYQFPNKMNVSLLGTHSNISKFITALDASATLENSK